MTAAAACDPPDDPPSPPATAGQHEDKLSDGTAQASEKGPAGGDGATTDSGDPGEPADPAEPERATATSASDALTSENRQASKRHVEDNIGAITEALLRMGVGPTYNISGGTLIVGGVRTGRDYVGRDSRTGGRAFPAEEPGRSGSFDGESLHRTGAAWVRPDCFEAARTRLDRCSVVLLQGARGTGRVAIAQRLLMDRFGSSIRSLPPDCDLEALDVGSLDASTGYVLEPGNDTRPSLRAWYLAELGSRLSAAGSALVVVIDETLSVEEDAAEHVIRVEMGDAVAALAAHLSYELRGELDPKVRELVAGDRIEELVDEACKGDGQRGIVRLAGGLAEVLRGRRTLDAVEAEVRERSAWHVRTWFLAELDDSVRAFAIALAIFEGLPYTVVSWAARDLETILAADDDGEEPAPASRLGRRRGELLDRCAAEIFSDRLSSGYGMVHVEAVRFCRRSYPPEVLQLFWQEYDRAHPALLAWLTKLGRSGHSRVRVGAAVAVGVLSLMDFNHIRQTVLTTWADDSSWASKQAAASALAVPASRTAFESVIRNLLREWADPERPSGRRLVAASSWGAPVGARNPTEALTQMGELAAPALEDIPLLQTIMNSTTELFVAGDDKLVDQVLQALLSWAEQSRAAKWAAAACFLQIADLTRTRAVPDTESWPALVSLGASDDRHRKLAADALHLTLNIPPLSRAALEILRGWADEAEADERIRRPLSALLVEATRTPKDMQRLRHHLNRWRSGRDPVPQTVAVIVRELTERKGNLL